MRERIFALTRVLERDLPKVNDNMSVAMIYARFVLPDSIVAPFILFILFDNRSYTKNAIWVSQEIYDHAMRLKLLKM